MPSVRGDGDVELHSGRRNGLLRPGTMLLLLLLLWATFALSRVASCFALVWFGYFDGFGRLASVWLDLVILVGMVGLVWFDKFGLISLVGYVFFSVVLSCLDFSFFLTSQLPRRVGGAYIGSPRHGQ